jgi:hypothetical protein
MDALDKVAGRKMGKEQKVEYAKIKREEEEKSAVTDRATIDKTSQAFRDKVAADRKRLGLDKPQPTSMFCSKCFSMRCVC